MKMEGNLIQKLGAPLYNSNGSNESSNNDSGYYSDHEEFTSDSTASQTTPRRKMMLGRSLSDAPMPVDLLEKRRMTRSNSDVGKESKINSNGEENAESVDPMDEDDSNSNTTHNATDNTSNNAPEHPIKGPIKSHVRALLTRSNHSASSDDNDNDERETTDRVSHPHHGARRWRQILDEKTTLQTENQKVCKQLR